MILTELQIEEAIAEAVQAFPHLTDWQFTNQKNDEYFGFTLWGKYELDPELPMSREFFVTLETFEDKWRGYLTVGQHSYLWSDADMGDAHLVGTEDYSSLTEAITDLKTEILRLFQAFSVI